MNITLIRLTVTQSELFSGWPACDATRLIEAADLITIESGIHLAEAGDRTDYLYLLAVGSIRLKRPIQSGLELGGLPLLPGDFYGLTPLITGQPLLFTAICREDCVLVRIPGKPFLEIIANNSNLFFSLFFAAHRQYVALLNCYESVTMRSVRARVATILISIGARMRSRNSLANVRLSQEEIAGMLGTRRQVINRALKSLEDECAIVVKYGRILLVDLQKLEKLSRDEDSHP